LKEAGLGHTFAIITDSTVESLYGTDLSEGFTKNDLENKIISFPPGEQNKNRDTKAWIEDQMLENKFARDSVVIALGGGVVGDIAGYVAASYARGLPYVQIPTTLVACVDSSIGGKTAVDTAHGKNLVGAFHQPWAVYIDVNTLLTLNDKEIREGLAETIKYGVISDDELFSFLEENMHLIFSYDKKALTHIIKRGCLIKAKVVEKDEKESNLRKILNFGHTIGHAVENLSQYKISHGEAISIGMVAEGKLAVKMQLWSEGELNKLVSLIMNAGLATQIPDYMKVNDIISAMKLDKKSRSGQIEMVLPKRIGEMASVDESYGIKIEESLIEETI
ncbi:MAG: 3-dehydroquinate synthase, partial [Deltaproteobacteria bacterium]|nr:3-dehydroquinate synthase [Deltaproteobacteria bacterium]